MNFKNFSDPNLVDYTFTKIREETNVLTEILFCFREIERRRLFSSYKFSSLFDMAVKHFGYSPDQACRRISAMRLIKDLPEVEEKITSGEINLTQANLMHSLFRQEEKLNQAFSKSKKLEILNEVSLSSKEQTKKITLKYSSQPQIKPDRTKVIADDKLEFKFTATAELQKKIQTLKGYLAHKHPNISNGELFELLCDLGIKEFSPAPARVTHRRFKISRTQVRRDVFAKANNKCENCGSAYALQEEHIHAKALGGKDEPKNLRLFCRSCNQRAAIEVFGINKMQKYLEKE